MHRSVGKNIYYVAQYFNGEPVIVLTKELEKSQWYPFEKLEELQWHRIKKLIDYVYEYVPFYRQRFIAQGIRPEDIRNLGDFRELPCLTKDELMEFKELLISQNPIGQYSVANTSGSTGKPLSILMSKTSWGYHHANIFRALKWYDISIGDKQARIGGTSTILKKRVFEKVKDMIFNRIKFPAIDMTDTACIKFYEKMLDFAPCYLYGYPSAIYQFVNILKDKGVDGKVLKLKIVVCHGEELDLSYKNEIEDFFKCKVVNGYGAAEVGIIAYECPEGNMHIPIESILFETTYNNKLTEEGGEVVVTDLHNYVMPLIRYKIGDIGTLVKEKCSCGRGLPVMGTPKGKIRSIITTPDGKRVHTVIFNSLFKDLLVRGGNVRQYQIIQTSPEDFVIHMVKNGIFTTDHISFLSSKLQKTFGNKVNFSFNFVNKINKLPSGKFITFIKKF